MRNRQEDREEAYYEFANTYEYYEQLIKSREINNDNYILLLHINDEIKRLQKRFRKQRLQKLLGEME